MTIVNNSVASALNSLSHTMASRSYLDEKLNSKSKYVLKDKYSELKLEPDKIMSSLLNEEVLTLLQTIKNILISNNIVSEEQFTQEYNKVCKTFEKRIEQQKIVNKLQNKE